MKYIVIVLAALLVAPGVSGQKIKLSKEAKGKYVEQSNEQEAGQAGIAVYQIINLEFDDDSDGMNIALDRGTGELASKSSEMVFPELEKVIRLKLTKKAEVDLLNYLGEAGWDVFAIETTVDRKKTTRKLYLRKLVYLEE
jgi:hypothetical protein